MIYSRKCIKGFAEANNLVLFRNLVPEYLINTLCFHCKLRYTFTMKFIFMVLFLTSSGLFLFAQWDRVTFEDADMYYSASSELEKPSSRKDFGRYSPHNLFDHNTSTAWVEGEEGSGIGSYILAGSRFGLTKYILIYNGYQDSESLFQKNNRVKELKLTLFIGFILDTGAQQFGFNADTAAYKKSALITLNDEMGVQRFGVPFDREKVEAFRENERNRYHMAYPGSRRIEDFIFVKFEIASVYKGSKWDDTCIAELEFTNNTTGFYIPVNQKINKIYQKGGEGDIFVHTSSGQNITLVEEHTLAEELKYTDTDEFLNLQIMDVSLDNEWALIDYQHGFSTGGHIEETQHLWSVRRMEEVPSVLLESSHLEDLLGFTAKNDTVFLETYQGKQVLLEEIGLDMDNLKH